MEIQVGDTVTMDVRLCTHLYARRGAQECVVGTEITFFLDKDGVIQQLVNGQPFVEQK